MFLEYTQLSENSFQFWFFFNIETKMGSIWILFNGVEVLCNFILVQYKQISVAHNTNIVFKW